MKKFSDIIKDGREKLGISQRELARRINIDNSYISRIEKGQEKPSINFILKISKELNLDSIQLILMNYSQEEINSIEAINPINDIFHFINEDVKEKMKIKDENNNDRISLIKILEAYQNKELDIEETIGCLSCLTNENMYNYLTKEELEKIKK